MLLEFESRRTAQDVSILELEIRMIQSPFLEGNLVPAALPLSSVNGLEHSPSLEDIVRLSVAECFDGCRETHGIMAVEEDGSKLQRGVWVLQTGEGGEEN